MTLPLLDRDIDWLARQVWSSLFELPLDAVSRPEPLAGPGTLTSRVRITGAWDGEVIIRCTLRLARRMAGTLFEVSPQHAEIGAIRDAMNEVANIIGGNLKTLLPEECTMSLPSTSAGTDGVALGHTGILRTASFDCDGEALQVQLVESVA